MVRDKGDDSCEVHGYWSSSDKAASLVAEAEEMGQ